MITANRTQKAVGRQTARVRGRWLSAEEKPNLNCEIPGGYRTQGLVISVIVAAVITEAAVRAVAQVPSQNGVRPGLAVTVRVYNYAEASRRTMSGAESEAGRIIGATGVAATWLDCLAPRGQLQSASDEAGRDCGGPVSGATVVLRILPRSTTANTAFLDTMFGYADGSALASVFYGRIEDLADGLDRGETEIPVILGHAIAHEIGHLLLGSASHSKTGIMCGQWDHNYLRRALMGRQIFSPEQTERIQAEVLRRTQASEAAPNLSLH